MKQLFLYRFFSNGLLAVLVLLAPLSAGAAQGPLKTCAAAAESLTSKNLEFALFHSQFPGKLATTVHKLRVSGKHYKIDSISTAEGLLALFYSGNLTQRSEGLVNRGQGLEPVYYSEKRGEKPLTETVVNTETGMIEFRRNNEKAEWRKKTQDRLSLVYQIPAILACNEPVLPGARIELSVMTTGHLDEELFILQGTEELETGLSEKKVTALKFSNTPPSGDDRISLWFDANNQFLPVQIQVEDPKGKRVTQIIQNWNAVED